MRDTAAVIVTYNRKGMLQKCINHLLKQEEASCDILIIDNGSTDGTYEAICHIIDNQQVHYFNTKKNLGGAGGFRVGIEKAVQTGYSFIWIMDDDTYVKPDSLSKLLDADSKLDGNYGFLSSIAYWKDGSICNMNHQYTALNKKLTDYESNHTPITMATFVSFFIKRETVLWYGLPITDFFIWADDLEYSRRISKKMPCYAIPSSQVLHNMASNQKVGIEQESEERLWRYKYLYRNEVFVFRREGPKGYLYLFLRVGLHLFRVIVRGKRPRGRKLKVILSSFISGFGFKPQIEYVRAGEQNETNH